MADGSLIFDTRIDENGFNSGVQNIGSSVSNLKNTFKKLHSKIVTTFSVVAVTTFTKKCIEASASVNALNSQFEQTFGTLSNKAKELMQTVAKDSGIVENRLQSVGTSIYAFAKTTGMDSVTALNLMQEALQVTADSAAYYDRSLEDTAESLKSFLKGNYENDSALGLSCTETTRNAMANRLYSKSFNELSESQKQLALLQMVKDANKLSGAMGQASREADGWENVIGNLKESWNQLLAVIGQPVLKVATQVVKQLSTAIQVLTKYANSALQAMSKLFGWEFDNNNSNATTLSTISDNAEIATENLEETEKQAKKLEKRLAGFDNLNVLADEDISSSENDTQKNSATALPVISTTDITPTENSINELSDIFQRFFKKLEPVKNALEKLWEALKPFQKFVSKALEDFYNNFLKPLGEWVLGTGLPRFLDIITDLLNSIDWNKLNKALADFWKSLEPFAENIGNGLLWFLENVLSPLAKWTINDVIPAFLNVLSGAIDVLNTAIETVKPVIKWLFDNFLTPIAEWTGGIIVSILKGIASGLKAIAEVPEAVIILESVAAAILAFQLYQFITGLNLAAIATSALSGAQAILNAVMAANPIGILIAILAGLIAALILLWNNCEWFRDFWINAWENIKTTLSNVWKSITEIFGNIGRWFADRFTEAVNGIKNAFKGISDFFGNIWKGITNTFSNVTNWFKNTFSKAWQSVKDVFSKGGEVFNGIKDGILNSLKSVINGLIDGINTVISIPFNGINTALEKIKGIEIAGWKPFEWINTIQTPQIPKLATGTVVPAHYGEFLAVLGDNKRETEIVSPLSTMKQAMREVLGEMNGINNNNNVEYRFIAQIGRRVIFDEIVEEDKLYRKRHGGKSAFAR